MAASSSRNIKSLKNVEPSDWDKTVHSIVQQGIKDWQNLSKLPIFQKGAISPPILDKVEAESHDMSYSTITVELTSKQACLPRSTFLNHSQTIHLSPTSGSIVARSLPKVDESDVRISTIYRKTKKRATLRQIPSKKDESQSNFFLELWDDDRLSECFEIVDSKGNPLHGTIFTSSSPFGGFEFSPDGTKLIYVAEALPPKSAKWDLIDRAGENALPPGRNFEFKDHWGEQLDGACLSRLFVIDLSLRVVAPIHGIDAMMCCFDPQWTPSGDGIVFVTVDPAALNQRRHGLVYCTNRASALYHVALPHLQDSTADSATRLAAGAPTLLSSSSAGGVKSPRFSPGGQFLVYLDSSSLATHNSCNRLFAIRWGDGALPFAAPITVMDAVYEPEQAVPDFKNRYPGIYCGGLVDRPWLSDTCLLFTSIYRSHLVVIKVDVETHLFEIWNPFPQESIQYSNLSVLDSSPPFILFSQSTFSAPPSVFLCCYRDDVVMWTRCLTTRHPSPVEHLRTELLQYAPPGSILDSAPESHIFEAFLLSLPSPSKSLLPQRPLIVFPHGGPHSSFVPYFSVSLMTYLLAGFDLLLVNYRGSLGFGQNSVESLPGNVGKQDVADVHQVVETLQSHRKYHPIFIHGGSHGGFLAAHMIGQYPTLFNAACLRNPVTNIASMVSGTDIRDWCLAEACGIPAQKQNIQTQAQVSQMYACSPIAHAHHVKAPTLVLVGQEDQRVPSFQGIEYHFLLKSQGVPTRLLSYQDCHALSKVPHDFDSAINALEWFTTYFFYSNVQQ